ncbi:MULTISPECIES: 2-oxoglutarate and iron-dependent oxygenase domain-containing protein [unclassified Streptomyces]|uniref:2-oxoglutarate and iron-dependent oxygenase domain-containing protein n=1 Tax=unclassified Streptomyces TaxID=2593676 RepID=UPI00234B490A|nr:2-oxoglutarate and iron-dependent oxygenase domain-containing protein [Streptomyces sp. M92]WCN02070.1 isopenicillin N synthase family oxygenase [Streptomyces sp. M92]
MTDIPVISLAQVEQQDEARICAEIFRACTETGFLVVRDHGIDRKVFDDAYELAHDFFRQAPENACVYAGGKGGPAGCTDKAGVGRLVLDGSEPLPFPADKRGIALRDALKTYFAACRTVADRVTGMLTVALGLGEFVDDALLTLFTKDGPGLQLCDPAGDWIDVDVPERDWFVVSTGQFEMRWSHEARVSPRWAGEGNRSGQSIALFKPAHDAAVIEWFPKYTQVRPAAYEPARHDDFSPERLNAFFGSEEVRS